ncbi:hypothetical protein E2C01_043703 [Portunus trituberculatus]|uniref:Uncharacterized protein n=1 Tax=Portunus trituberculatus TaxID=210409 RepID=A0A5B7FYA2_PORTR|nr:hypothetical protein [Portunus trituberculatus]
MAKFQGGTCWDSNLRVDVCPIPRSPPYPLRHLLSGDGVVVEAGCGVLAVGTLRDVEIGVEMSRNARKEWISGGVVVEADCGVLAVRNEWKKLWATIKERRGMWK